MILSAQNKLYSEVELAGTTTLTVSILQCGDKYLVQLILFRTMQQKMEKNMMMSMKMKTMKTSSHSFKVS